MRECECECECVSASTCVCFVPICSRRWAPSTRWAPPRAGGSTTWRFARRSSCARLTRPTRHARRLSEAFDHCTAHRQAPCFALAEESHFALTEEPRFVHAHEPMSIRPWPPDVSESCRKIQAIKSSQVYLASRLVRAF
eukprot:4216240-Pleurochrysis_carterae.AAC.1